MNRSASAAARAFERRVPLVSAARRLATSAAEPSSATDNINHYSQHSRRLARTHDPKSPAISQQLFNTKPKLAAAATTTNSPSLTNVQSTQIDSPPASSPLASIIARLLPPDSVIAHRLGSLLGLNSAAVQHQRHTLYMYTACVHQTESAFALHDNQQQQLTIIDWLLVEVGLPDTFQTWFSCTMLHVWMLMVRLRAEGPEGKQAIQGLIDHLFRDVEDRLWALGLPSGAVVSRSLKEFLSIFYGGVLAYDSTLTAPDSLLAAALWRNIFAMTQDSPPLSSNDFDTTTLSTTIPIQQPSLGSRPMTIHLAQVTTYVRRELAHLDTLSRDNILRGQISFSRRGIDSLTF